VGKYQEALGVEATRPRVVHMVTAPPTTRLMLGQLRALCEAGFEVIVMSAPGRELDLVAEQEGVRRVAAPMEREIAPWHDARSLWWLWRLMRRFHPALVNVGTAKAGLLGGLAAWLAGVPCRVYTLHGLRLETTTGLKRRLLIRTEKLACWCAHRVVCVSESVRTRALELGLTRREKMVLLGAGSFNGIDAARFAPTPERARAAVAKRAELGIAREVPVVGFVGRLTRDKGLPELVQAYVSLRERFPALRLLLIGRFETGDPVPEETRRFIESDPGVIHVGYVSDPSGFYHVMDVFALPTYREGFPTVALEAAAAGKAMVTTRATGARDAVVDGITGLIVPIGDAVALTEALERLLSDRALAMQMGKAARDRAERDFRQDRLWAELADLYRSLLAERGSRRAGKTSLAAKRMTDLCGAAVGLLLGAPLLALAALAIRLTDGPPVLFRQPRTGKGGVEFAVYKLRTMRAARDQDGRVLTDGERLTSVGRVLRRFSLDELPQLWNVLRGEMSLVGPRPLLPEYLPAYTERERLRHRVKPGITGSAQVNGRHTLPFSKRLELDSWYAEHWSLGLDAKILLQTLPKALWSRERMACQDEGVDDRGFWRHLQEIRPGRGESV
jgi:lipopolysaccharide/colanic/teichoic acid biosynthesis glycosyltransferase